MILGDVRRIPYGVADFRRLRERNALYVDRTRFIAKLEELEEPAILFLRPRRFGKTLWCSTLFYYYDKAHVHLWDRLFRDTYIGENPTPLKAHTSSSGSRSPAYPQKQGRGLQKLSEKRIDLTGRVHEEIQLKGSSSR